jgi:hypothetical protein
MLISNKREIKRHDLKSEIIIIKNIYEKKIIFAIRRPLCVGES